MFSKPYKLRQSRKIIQRNIKILAARLKTKMIFLKIFEEYLDVYSKSYIKNRAEYLGNEQFFLHTFCHILNYFANLQHTLQFFCLNKPTDGRTNVTKICHFFCLTPNILSWIHSVVYFFIYPFMSIYTGVSISNVLKGHV